MMTTEVGAPLRSRRGVLLLVSTVLASSMAFLDATVVNIALPAIDDDFEAGTSALTWVVTGYALPLASLILLAGALGDRCGQRAVFKVGVVVFTICSLCCALAPSIEVLISARAVQGVGAALLTPASLALLRTSIRTEDQGKAVGLWSGLTGVSSALGPFLAGGLIELGSWRTIFLLNLPLAAVVLVLSAALPAAKPSEEAATSRFDAVGASTLTVGLAALTLGLTNWSRHAFTDPLVIGLLFMGVASLVLFGMWQLTGTAPLIPREAWSSRPFVSINAVTLVVYAVLSAVFLWIVVALQVVARFSPLQAGVALLPITALMLLFSSWAGALSDRRGARQPMVIGISLSALSLVWFTRIDASVSFLWEVLPPAILLGAGLTVMVTPLTTGALAALPSALAGTASGVNNAAARTGGLLGIAALPVVTGLGRDGFADPDALARSFDIAMWVCAGVLTAAAAGAYRFVPRSLGRSRDPGTPLWHCSICQPPTPRAASGAASPVVRTESDPAV